MQSRWEIVSGADLSDAYERQGTLSDLLPKAAGIYLWRRALQIPRTALTSSLAFTKWLNTAMQTPIAEVRDHRASHFAVIDRLTIRGANLTSTKLRQFHQLMATRKKREWLAGYIRDLSYSTPPLYCGETRNLRQRIREHLAGETGFSQRIQNPDLSLSWSDLDLVFLRLDHLQLTDDAQHSELRKLLELLTTAFSVAGYVSRRG